jgi:hypothetical protein
MINDLLAETAIGIQSPLEYRWIKLVERPHRLPVPSAPTNCHQADSLMAGMRNSACWSSWMDGAITTDSAGSGIGGATTSAAKTIGSRCGMAGMTQLSNRA